jgi:hypothetical protein
VSSLPPFPAEDAGFDLRKIRMKSRAQRQHKVGVSLLAQAAQPGCSFSAWLDSLPRVLAAEQLRQIVDAIVAARQAERPVVVAFGGHVIKTGCGPLLVDLMERGVVTAVATNGSGAIHDLELAETGATSEDVAENLRDGSFGMVEETCLRMNAAAARGACGVGLGRALGELLDRPEVPYRHLSVFAAAARLNLPATVHVAVGTDTVHMHPQADGAAIGKATLIDFHLICRVVAGMTAAHAGGPGGIWLNVGSAVVLPEVFLKAVSVARNLGYNLQGMHTANLDMIPHYRPTQNVVTRPVAPGYGHTVIGPHELLLPLLRQAVLEKLERSPRKLHADR